MTLSTYNSTIGVKDSLDARVSIPSETKPISINFVLSISELDRVPMTKIEVANYVTGGFRYSSRSRTCPQALPHWCSVYHSADLFHA